MSNDTGLVSPAGEAVKSWTAPTNGEVMGEASKKCGTCRGKGMYHAWVKQRVASCDNTSEIDGPSGKLRSGPCEKRCICEADMQIRVPRVCMCAVRRWEKKHGVDVISGKPKVKA